MSHTTALRCGFVINILASFTSFKVVAVETVLATRLGQIRGTKEVYGHSSVHKYLNIPYAKPPVGVLRFQKPQPISQWEGVMDGTQFGPLCPQNHITISVKNFTNLNHNHSEDCLQLNVYVPGDFNYSLNPKSVMVWFHGGAFEVGGSHTYDGTPLAVEGDVIVITVNYRLGLLGFMAWDDVTVTGNYGLWDQVMALQWVKDNIDSFGGDPNSVTLFGQSAGSLSVSILSLLPVTKGLFQRTILESGVATSFIALNSRERILKTSHRVMELLGCDPFGNTQEKFSCIQNKPIHDIMFAQSHPSVSDYFKDGTFTFSLNISPYVDGDLIPENPVILLSDPNSDSYQHFMSLDVMAGTTTNEGVIDLFLLSLSKKYSFNMTLGIPRQIFHDVIVPAMASETIGNNTKHFEEMVNHLRQFYLGANMADQALKFCYMTNDAFFFIPMLKLLDKHSTGMFATASTYEYVFSGPNFIYLPLPWYQGTPHGTDVLYLFDIQKFASTANHTISPGESDLSRNMLKMWTNFAKTGNPDSPGLPHWPNYDITHRHYMKLDTVLSVGDHMYADRAQFWYNLMAKTSQGNPVSIG